MNQVLSNKTQYIVEVDNVREVILVGTADMAFWREHLRDEGLFPYNQNGKTEVSISATDLKWKGVRSNELTISILVSAKPGGSILDGAFLVHAYNSIGLFAFAERNFFQTPYYPGKIEVQDQVPAKIELILGKEKVFNAQMQGTPSRIIQEDQAWEGAIFLPGRTSRDKKPGNHFYAYLGGLTDIYGFSSSTGSLEINAPQNELALHWLKQSNFEPKEWRIRNRASHKKSDTAKRKT